MKSKARAPLLFLALAAAACSASRFVHYKSVSGDWSASVPWGWNVVADAQDKAFAQATFIGAFDPDFYLGAPSLSVRWYRSYAPHRLRDGRLEMYADADDFVDQTLRTVYGPKYILYGDRPRQGGGREIIERPEDIVLPESGLRAKVFVALSPAPAPQTNQWGLEQDKGGKPVNMRLHAYAVVPLPEGSGFYVLCYPATRRGYDRYLDRFRGLVRTFRPWTDGPGGGKLRAPVRAGASS